MSTVLAVAQQISHYLYTGIQAKLNVLQDAIDADDETFYVVQSLEYMRIISGGDFIVIDDEWMYVWEVDVAAKLVTVQRGMFGTTAAAHTADSIIEVNPRFPLFVIRRAMLAEVRSWPRSLFEVSAVSLSVPSTSLAVDLDLDADQARLLRPLRVLARVDELSDWTPIDWRMERSMPTDDFPSGVGLYLQPKLGITPTGSEIRVLVALEFDTSAWANSTNLQTAVGIPVEMEDIIEYGTAARLLSFTEIQRTDAYSQGESRVASEVPATHRMSTAQSLQQWRDRRIAEESTRLMHAYGVGM